MLDRPHEPTDRKTVQRRERNRRYRERMRARVRRLTFTGEIDDVGIGWLIAHQYLAEEDAADPHTLRAAIGKAVTKLIEMSSR